MATIFIELELNSSNWFDSSKKYSRGNSQSLANRFTISNAQQIKSLAWHSRGKNYEWKKSLHECQTGDKICDKSEVENNRLELSVACVLCLFSLYLHSLSLLWFSSEIIKI